MKINNILRRLILLALCAAMVISVMPVTVFAGKDKDDSDTPVTEPPIPVTSTMPSYIAQVVVGEDGYKGTGSLTVNYIDASGNPGSLTVDLRKAYKTLFPDEALSKSNDVHTRVSALYSAGLCFSYAFEVNSIARYYTGAYFDGNFSGLESYGAYTFSLGDLPAYLKEITAVSITLPEKEEDKDKDKDSLSIQSLRIIRLDNWDICATDIGILGSYFNGTFSNQIEGEWRGELVAEASGTCNTGTTTTFSTANRKLTWYASNRTTIHNVAVPAQGVSMHFADTPTAGIETLMAGRNDDSIQELYFGSNFSTKDFEKLGTTAYRAYGNLDPIYKECMNLEITYLDVLGETRKVQIPVLTAYLINILCDNNGKLAGSDYKTWISGILQQNETIALNLRLAQYQSLVGMQLTYGDAPDQMVTNSGARSVKTNEDTIAIDNICFYEGINETNFRQRYSTKHLTCLLDTTLTPKYSYTAHGPSGSLLATGYKLNVTLDNGRLLEGAPSQKELEDTYVFTLTNSSVEHAGTYSGIYMDITYVDTNGFEHTLEDLSLKELVGEFYGYTYNHDVLLWKQSNSVTTGHYIGDVKMERYMQYWESMRYPGNTTMFRISATNVAYFKSISFSIQNEGSEQELFLSDSDTQIDSWQLNSVSVQKATSIGQRYSDGRIQRPLHVNITAFPRWKRDVTGQDVAWSNQKMLLQSGVLSQTIFLTYVESNGTVVKPDQTIKENTDYLDRLPTSMTYYDTLKDLGLAIPKYTYQVTVHVAEVPDAGSTNYFYFQLIFENGTSAVVLANQQLNSDSFRQGQEESFQIQTTQNYGVLKSVRIICDSATSDSNVFDKLNINKIEVKLEGYSGVNRVWVIGNIGWIDINYADEGADSYYNGSDVIIPSETTNDQLIREYAVTGITTAVDLLFSINTANGSKLSLKNLNSTSWADGKFWATLVYLDSTGARKEKGFDLTNQLQTFNDTDELTWMYRPNHVDRFILSVPDISSVISLEITRSEGGDEWHVGGITVQQIGGAGGVYLSYNSEYIRDLKNAENLATSVQEGTVVISENESYVFDFTKNTITISQADDDSWDATISREPDTTNDTLNVYLYSGGFSKDYPFNGNTAIKASLKYTTRYGSAMQTSFTFQRGTSGGKSVMYAEGVTVNDMATLNAMSLSDQSGHSSSTVVAYAVIERVRGDVIINTYHLYYGNFLEYSTQSTPSSVAVNPMWQKVTLLSAAGQDDVSLTPETHDIAVALRYTSTNSMDGPKKVYQSPYIYLTDQQIMMLSSNQNVELEFQVGSIDQIVGLSVISTGPVFRYDGATVQNFDGQNNSLLGSFNADSGFSASTVETIVQLSQGKSSTAVFSFITPPNTTVAGAGTFGQVSMMITYTDSSGQTMTRIVNDLISRLPTGTSFTAGTTADLTLLLPDAQSIEKVTLYAPDDDWYLSAVSVIMTRSDGTVEQKGVRTNSWVKMLEPLEVDLNAVDNTVLGLTINAHSQKLNMSTSSNGNSYMTVDARVGDTITLIPSVSYSGTPDTSCTWNPGEWESYCTMGQDKGMSFSVPQNAQPGASYLISVSATADPSISVTIMIRIVDESVLSSAVKVICKAEGTGQTVEGAPANGAMIHAYANDNIFITPTYKGNLLLASEWTWTLYDAEGITSINGAGELEWQLRNCAMGDNMVIWLMHKQTGEQIRIEVLIVGNSQVKNVRVTVKANGTGQEADSDGDSTVYIDAYADDVVTITPYADDTALTLDVVQWMVVSGDCRLARFDAGYAKAYIENKTQIGETLRLTMTHLESGKTVTIVITVVPQEVSADSITVEAVFNDMKPPVTGIAGTTITLEADATDIITVQPYINGEKAHGSSWEWDLTEVQGYVTEDTEGGLLLILDDDLEPGTVLTMTLTHPATKHKLTIQLTITEYNSATGVKTLEVRARYGDGVIRINPGETAYLDARAKDYITLVPYADYMTTSKSDWVYTCDRDTRVENYISDDGRLREHPLWLLMLNVGDTITYTVTHAVTNETFTVVVTIIEDP